MALRDQPYLPLYIQDIMTDEKLNECCASTHGIFIKGIMCLMHKSDEYGKILLKQKYKQTEKQSKNFACQLVKHLPYSAQEIENAIDELIKEKVCYFEKEYLCQKRMIRDNEISLIRAESGKKGGLFAQAKIKANLQPNTEDEDEDTFLKRVQGEEITQEKNGYITPKLFEDFWKIYPRKGSKGKALTKWNQLCNKKENRLTWKEIRKAIHDQKGSDQWKENVKFIPLAATWLNQTRWVDDPKEMIAYHFDEEKQKQFHPRFYDDREIPFDWNEEKQMYISPGGIEWLGAPLKS
jgi:hypothetical protein